MAQLRQDYEQFEQAGAEVVVVGPDTPEKFREFWAEHGLSFVGLPNPEHTVLKQYGQEIKLFKLGRMLAQALIDRRGSVRFIHYGNGMQDIPKTETMLGLLAELNAEEPVPVS